MDNIRVIYCDLPYTIGGYTVATQDGYYTIVLNSRLSHEQHLMSYHHEMIHIESGDYDKETSVELIEMFCHGLDK